MCSDARHGNDRDGVAAGNDQRHSLRKPFHFAGLISLNGHLVSYFAEDIGNTGVQEYHTRYLEGDQHKQIATGQAHISLCMTKVAMNC